LIRARREIERTLARRAARDPLLREIGRASESIGAPCWLVGGAVRDTALGRRSSTSDLDLLATRRVPSLVRRLRERWRRRAFRFRKRGVTTWRFVVAARQVDLVDATRRGLLGDLRRRELTVNAVAFDLLERRLEDPLHGLRDLRLGRLRLPRAGVMREDPVRALRAARFLAQLPGFRLDRASRAEASACGRGLRRASAERVRDELDKLLAATDPRRGLGTLEELGLIDSVLPELAPLRRCVAGAERPDVWRHTLDCLSVAARPPRLPAGGARRAPSERRILRWALLLHDISKPETLGFRADGRPTFHGHETLGARRADVVLRRLRLARADRRRIVRLIRLHLRPSLLAEAGSPARGLRRLVGTAEEDLPLLALHAACDALASGAPDAVRRWRRLRRVLLSLLELHRERRRVPLPKLVNGRDVQRLLALDPGPRVGRLLERVREAQEDGEIRTRQEALAYLERLGPAR
jgi:poly(A) polymerase